MDLVEREAELASLTELLEEARAGAGGLALVEAPAGQGKTALLRALRERAKGLGMRVVTATGGSLERDFPFGVVRQLFEGEFRHADPGRVERLLAGAGSMARIVFDAAPDPETANDVSHAQLNGLFWFTVNLSEEQPLVLVVDDAHWSDGPSLRFLGVLARRLEARSRDRRCSCARAHGSSSTSSMTATWSQRCTGTACASTTVMTARQRRNDRFRSAAASPTASTSQTLGPTGTTRTSARTMPRSSANTARSSSSRPRAATGPRPPRAHRHAR